MQISLSKLMDISGVTGFEYTFSYVGCNQLTDVAFNYLSKARMKNLKQLVTRNFCSI